MTDEELAKKFLIGETCDTCNYSIKRETLKCLVGFGSWGEESCPPCFTCFRWVKNKVVIRRPERK